MANYEQDALSNALYMVDSITKTDATLNVSSTSTAISTALYDPAVLIAFHDPAVLAAFYDPAVLTAFYDPAVLTALSDPNKAAFNGEHESSLSSRKPKNARWRSPLL